SERDDSNASVLAWLRRIVPSQLRRGDRRKRKRFRKQKLMNWLHKMVFPVRRVCLAFAARVKSRRNGGGLLKLHDDIQTCGYKDVQVMWEMLHRTESELTSNNHRKRKPKSFWKIFVWHNNRGFSIDHA
ncbi:hypothetical protein R6Q57_002087, partial [Mikania cordata]